MHHWKSLDEMNAMMLLVLSFEKVEEK